MQPTTEELHNLSSMPVNSLLFSNIKARQRHLIPLFFSLILLAAILVVTYYGYTQLFRDILRFGPAIFWQSGKYFFIAFALCTILFLVTLFFSFPPKKQWVVITENSLLLRKGKHSREIPWKDFTKLFITLVQKKFLLIPTLRRHQLVLTPVSGKQIILDSSFERFDSLLAAIRDKFFTIRSRQILADFIALKKVDFEAISLIHEEGIQVHRRLISFANIQDVSIKQGYFLLKQKGTHQKIKVRVNQIANLDILLAILKYKGVPTQA